MASRSSTVIISSSPIAKMGVWFILTIAETNRKWLPFGLSNVPLAPKSYWQQIWYRPPNLIVKKGGTGSL